MTEIQILEALVSLGALGIITYLFINGKLVSSATVDRLSDAQANHINDLRRVMDTRLTEVIDVLKEIRENGAMTKRKR